MEKVYDKIRKKYVALMPEEKVRQKMISFLIREKKYPESLLRIERKIINNGNVRNLRTDIIVFEKQSIKPLILVECKSENVKITKDALMQVMEYNALVNARYVVITNGKQLLCLEKNEKKYESSQIPHFNEELY